MIPLVMIVDDVLPKRMTERLLAEQDELRETFLFADFTQRSANEFKSGLRAGSLTGATPIASMVRWNDSLRVPVALLHSSFPLILRFCPKNVTC